MVACLKEICHETCILDLISAEEIPHINIDLLSENTDLLLRAFVRGFWHEAMSFLNGDPND